MEEPLLPKDIGRYEHHITGYGNALPIKWDLDSSDEFLYSQSEHSVYKPVQEPPKGLREIEFYRTACETGSSEKLEREHSQLMAILRSYLSKFLGVCRHPLTNRRYIWLSDILDGFARPSIIDFKMGVQRHEPDVAAIIEESRPDRYAHRKLTGFLISGIHAWRPEEKCYELYGKRYGREVTLENMRSRVLAPLLSGSAPHHCLRLIRLICARLETLRLWFESQRLFHFYSSSILLGVESCPEALETRPPRDLTVVRMVDFTHVVPAKGLGPDKGYLLGLCHLIQLCRDYEQDALLANGEV